MSLKFGSVCSGIEAASVAWHPLGWKAAWLSEIEPFPSALLAHHYPEVPNLGDMTTLPGRIRSGDVSAPDVFCGGTPCQAFSVAGLRKSLDDARGNLSLVFCEIADAIDSTRAALGEPPVVIFWENVPGVLNTKDNAFGCFLAGLAGEDDPIVPPRGKWSNAGCVFGPQRAVAWRVFDAQHFGVAQRRRRVFVVASAREGFNPAAVLFESEGVRRDSVPCRESWENPANGAGQSSQSSGIPLPTAQGNGGIGFDSGSNLTCPADVPVMFECNKTFWSPSLGNLSQTLIKESTASVFVDGVLRRLTPTEFERLQGFPDGYTNIPWRKADTAPAKHRYKALGNSWAVPNVRWIGRRIAAEIAVSDLVGDLL
jgi:DNA (cytosine-5)-methyltransferase 1